MELLEKIIKLHYGSGAEVLSKRLIGGGCINHAARVETSEGVFFVKWSKNDLDMFQAEIHGLNLLRNHTFLKIPKTFYCGSINEDSYLLMEPIESGLKSNRFWKNFAIGLAQLHQISSEVYGLDRNNYIGSLPQQNQYTADWIEFFIQYRLTPQLKLARNTGKINAQISNRFDQLFAKLKQLIPVEAPSLIHGDLWSGNFLIDNEGQAALIDPAVYFGHRETEIAFTQLFGGFDKSFYQYYNDEYPLETGFSERIELHNLYPLMVHVNLFGSSYLAAVRKTLEKFT